MKRFGCLLVLGLAMARADVYVSPAGNDGRSGKSAAEAVRTLERAQEIVRSQNAHLTGDLAVILADGIYRLDVPLVLDGRDSGGGGHRVVYKSALGAHPILSGGVRITGWRQVDAARNLWSAPAPDALRRTRQLFVNGVRAYRTRGRLPVPLTETPAGYTADSEAMTHWRNPSQIEFVYTGGNGLWSEGSYGLGPWTEPRCLVDHFEGTKVVMAQPGWNNSTKRVAFPDPKFHRAANLVGPASVGKRPEFVENAYELLGTPGQWYFDEPSRLIYYVPRSSERMDSAEVEAPVLERLIDGRGTAGAPIHDLAFEGLQFSYATWLFPSTPEGFSEIQANFCVTGADGYQRQGLGDMVPDGRAPFGDWTPIAGNVTFACAEHVSFTNDVFAHLGGAGLVFADGAHDCLVQDNLFTDISGNGVMLGGVDRPEAPDALTTQDDRIENNYFRDIAAEYHGGVAIVAGYVRRCRIAHNQIDHVPYSGISIGWGGWPDKVKRAGVANNSQDNVVADNLVFDHMLLLADGAAIYTQGLTGPDLEHGEKVVGNIVRDQFGSGHAIYSDNGSCYMTVRENVILHTNFDNWGSHHADYYDGGDGSHYDPIVVENNWWQQGETEAKGRGIVMGGNKLISAVEQAGLSVRRQAGIEKPFRALLTENVAPAVPPEAPSRVAVSAGSRFALIAWCPPCFLGGGAVRSYTVTSSAGRRLTITAAEFDSQGFARIDGLTNGQPVTFTVRANNANGASVASLPSAPVTPSAAEIAKPSAPRSLKILRSKGMASVHFAAPAHDGGSPVTSFVLTTDPDKRRVVFTGRAVITLGGTHTTFFVVDGLPDSGTGHFELTAVNAAGEGPAVSLDQ